MSFLDRQKIGGYLLHSNEDDATDTEESIEILIAFSFLTKDEAPRWINVVHELDRAIYSMHRLVQLATRAWLEENDTERIKILASHVLGIMNKLQQCLFDPQCALCGERQYHWQNDIVLLPALLNIDFPEPPEECSLAQAKLHIIYASNKSKSGSAQMHLKKAIDIRKAVLGMENVYTYTAIAALARRTHLQLLGAREKGWGDEESESARLLREAFDGFYTTIVIHNFHAKECAFRLLDFFMASNAGKGQEAKELFQENS